MSRPSASIWTARSEQLGNPLPTPSRGHLLVLRGGDITFLVPPGASWEMGDAHPASLSNRHLPLSTQPGDIWVSWTEVQVGVIKLIRRVKT